MTALWPLHAALLLIAAAAIGGPVWAVFVYAPPPDYQALAETSCKCARLKTDKAGKDTCWRDFDAATDNARANASPTACFPISEVYVGVPGATEVVIAWDIIGDGTFCTRDEAVSAEALFARIYTGDASLSEEKQQENLNRAVAALEDLSRAYARGERVEPAQSQGCTQ